MDDEKKYSFSNVTVRFYDEDFMKLVREEFMKSENKHFNPKGSFIYYYFKLGFLNAINERNFNDNIAKEILSVKDSVETLSNYLKQELMNKKDTNSSFLEIQGSMYQLLKLIAEVIGIDSNLLKLEGISA